MVNIVQFLDVDEFAEMYSKLKGPKYNKLRGSKRIRAIVIDFIKFIEKKVDNKPLAIKGYMVPEAPNGTISKKNKNETSNGAKVEKFTELIENLKKMKTRKVR